MTKSDLDTHVPVRFPRNEMTMALEYFRRWGYVVIEDAFPVSQGTAFWSDFDQALAVNTPMTFCVWGKMHTYPNVPLEGRRFPRVVDIESHVPSSRGLMLAPSIVSFLSHYYAAPPTCLQTLTYMFSSEQGAHSDKTLVSPPPAIDYDRETLAAAWLALEDSNESNGALVIYPASHLIEKRGFFDGFNDDYGKYSSYVDEICRSNGSMPTPYHAKAGEILFWHGDLVHAGGMIVDTDDLPTRRSLVCHYAKIAPSEASRDSQWIRTPFNGASYFSKV